jgi:hypothetical protein
MGLGDWQEEGPTLSTASVSVSAHANDISLRRN